MTRPLSDHQLEWLFEQLAECTSDDSLPLAQRLRHAATATTGAVCETLREVADAVEGGAGLAEALDGTGRVSRFHTELVSAATENGRLHMTLRRLRRYSAGERKCRRHLMRRMLYPMFLMGLPMAVTLALGVLMWHSMIVMEEILNDIGAEINMWGSAAMVGILVAVGLMACAIPCVVVTWLGTWRRPPELLYVTPVIGPLVRRLEIQRFCRALSISLEAGVTPAESLGLIDKLVHWPVLRRGARAGATAIAGNDPPERVVKWLEGLPGELALPLSRMVDPVDTEALDQLVSDTDEDLRRAITLAGGQLRAVVVAALVVVIIGVVTVQLSSMMSLMNLVNMLG